MLDREVAREHYRESAENLSSVLHDKFERFVRSLLDFG